MKRWWTTIAISSVVAGTVVTNAAPAHAYVAGQERLAFVRYNGTDAAVRTMAFDGSTPKATIKKHGVTLPKFIAASYSPDGTKIVYAQVMNVSNVDLFVKTIGGRTQRLTSTPGVTETSAAWSPNGKRLAYLATDRSSYASLVVAKADGSDPNPILTSATDYIWYPSWSPDGGLISFSTADSGDEEIFLTTPSGNLVTQLTDNTGVNDFAGDWSPDGGRIAFVREPVMGPMALKPFGHRLMGSRRGVGSTGTVLTMRSDGTGLVPVTTDPNAFGRVVYGPKRTLVVSRLAHLSLDLYSVPAAGGAYTRLTKTVETYNTVDLLRYLAA